jgi:hypothetical protein
MNNNNMNTTTAMFATENLDFSYRAALALNNMSVSLLEQGCFHEGLRPFQDSLSILKGILGLRFGELQPSSMAHDDEQHSSSVQLKMQHATTLLAQCQTMGQSSSQPRRVKPSEAADVYALDHGDLTLMKDALRYGSSSSVAFPVYLRSTSSFDKDVQQQVAVVLYNLSLAMLLDHAHGVTSSSSNMDMDSTCNNRTEQQDSNSNNPLLVAFQYLSMAQTILSQSIEDANNHDEDQRLISMLLTSMVLNLLVQTYKYLNWHQKEQDTMSSLLLLESLVNEQEAGATCICIAGGMYCCYHHMSSCSSNVFPPAA